MDKITIEKPDNSHSRRKIPPHLGALFRYLIAGGCLFWVFYDIHPGRLLETLTVKNWLWIIPAIVLQLFSFVFQGFRWKFLLYPLGKLSWLRTTQAVYAGQFANGIFPMRMGELLRVYMVSGWLKVDFVAAIPSISIEFLFDLIWLAIAIGIAAFLIPLPSVLVNAVIVLVIFVIVATGFFAFVVFWERKASHGHHDAGGFIEKLWGRINRISHRLLDGLQLIGFSGRFFGALFISLLILIAQTAAFWLVMVALDIHLSFWEGAVVYLIVHLGTMLPNAPSNVGTYQFFTVLGLSLFGIDKTAAAGFSLLVFVLLTAPILLAGFFSIHQTGLTQKKIREDILTLLGRW
ncbi:MAG: lysylphosphatidylglycerol synthase transmembrane domain-containing protein [Candidatus Latescibacterota bacterium]